MIRWIDIEKSKDGILQILQVLKQFENDGEVRFIDGIQRRGFTELKIQQLICIVRERLNMTRRELLRLSEIALTYNKMWATDDNNCFRDAEKLFRKIRSTLKGTKIIYKRFTPICRSKAGMVITRSEFVNSTLAYAECGRDMYGLESYPESVSTLYAEMGAYFTNVVAVLFVCHQELTKEAQTSKDADLCLQLLNKQCKSIVGDMKDVIGLFSNEETSKDELTMKSRKSGSLKKFAQEGFHKYNVSSIKRFAISRAIENGAEFGLGNVESVYFVNDCEKGKKAKEIMTNFDAYAQKGRGSMMDSTAIVEFVCWTGLGLTKGYEFFTSRYTGIYDIPKKKSIWARFDSYRKSDPQAEKDATIMERKLASDFEKRISTGRLTINNTHAMDAR